MASARVARLVCAATFVLLAGAPAAAQASTRQNDIVVLDAHGGVEHHRATGATASTAAAAEPRPPARATREHRASTARTKRTVARELKRLRDRGAITPEDYDIRRADYADAKRAAKALTGTRRAELTAVILTMEDIARRGKLTRSRITPLWLTLERNVEWWTSGPLLSSGERAGFSGSELVWQYYPGHGLQIQWLGTFGKLNGLVKRKGTSTNAQASTLVDEILSLASDRAGGLAWEYLFPFGGGSPPWVSSLAQGTGLQALARSAVKLGRQADVLPVTTKALGIFRRKPPEGVRIAAKRGWDGPHYLQYSFAPSLYILNGFTQSIVALHDYAQLTGNATAQALYTTGQRELAREVPEYDTGAWSLYSTGAARREADVSYHELARDFLVSMCDRTQTPIYCQTADRFTAYESEPPALTLADQKLRGGRTGTLRLRLSKMSAVTVVVRRGDSVVMSRALGTVPYGLVRVQWAVPRRKGTYDISVRARDLNGNTAAEAGTVDVLKPVRKHKRRA
jgi:D-glucuronyl C5-epimerase C-terminus